MNSSRQKKFAVNKKKIVIKSGYFLISSLFCLGTLEIFSRLVRPVFPGAQKIDAMGKRLDGVSFNSPGASYFQYSSEYNVKTNIDKMGNRITPTSKNKSLEGVIFLGDSFTFGQGIADEETIASKFCELSNKDLNCINLGRPGGNTISALEKLRVFEKDNDIEGYTVFNLLTASTFNSFSGNDISDCLSSKKSIKNINKKTSQRNNYLLQIGRDLSKRSNLFRLLRLNAGTTIRSIGYGVSGQTVFDEDIECFVRTAEKIKLFTNSKKARYIPIIISPSNEIFTGLNEDNLNKIREVYDKNALGPTNVTVKDFYPIDGHYNASGAEKVARFLISVY